MIPLQQFECQGGEGTSGHGVRVRVGLLLLEELGHWLAHISGRWWR